MVRHYVPPSSTSRESLFALSAANRHRWRTMPNKGLEEEIPANADPCLVSDASPVPVQSNEHLSTSSLPHVITAPIIGSADNFPGLSPSPPPAPSPVPANPVANEREMVDKECFPMGSCETTLYERGWLDIGCGPDISITVEYSSHQHNPSCGDHTPLLPNVLRVDIDAPIVLIRVFGSLARDLLGLKVSVSWDLVLVEVCMNIYYNMQENYPGEYIKMTPFTTSPLVDPPPPPPLQHAPPPPDYDGPHAPLERTSDIFVSFKLRNITAEFPTVSHGDITL